MVRTLALSILFTVIAFAFSKDSFAVTYVDNGTNTNYDLNAGDSLFIAMGTYTGSIQGFPVGAKITVSDMAIFQPASMPSNSAGTMYVYGTVMITQPTFRTNTGFTLNNYGIFTVNATTTMNGNSQLWTNNYGAVLNFNGPVTVNGTNENNTIINYGTVNCSAMVTMTSGAQLTNYNEFYITGEFRVNGGTLENRGKLETTGLLNFNNGAAVIRNYCGMSSLGGIRNTSNNFYNYSYLWARNDLGLGTIDNSGVIINLTWNLDNITEPMIHGRDLIQTGTITGNGRLYFYGTTSQTGGVTGTNGITSDTLKMYDISRVNTSVFYDPPPPAFGGTVHPNAIYNAWGVPDSTRAYFVGCSIEILLQVPLAINWNYFFVNLHDDTPVLNWSAEYQQGTVFEVQRSYDGRNFSGIKQLPFEAGRSEYFHTDNTVNTSSPIAYYRIRAIEPGGIEKYTQIRNVRFNSKPGALHIYPNPFAGNFIIDYNAKENEDVIIRILNAAGQQKLVKNISVHKGTNTMQIIGASNFSKGIYIVQVSNGSSILASSKIIKQ